MTRALTILQEYPERKLTPASERLIIILEEVQGWAAWYVAVGMHIIRLLT